MAAVLILIITVLIGVAQAGYEYPNPAIPFKLPGKKDNFLNKQPTADDASYKTHESVVSYSVPIEDFHYLKHHKAEYHNSPYNDPQAGRSNTENTNHNHKTNDGSSVLQKIVQQSKNTFAGPDVESIGYAPNSNQYIGNNDNFFTVNLLVQETGISNFGNNDESNSGHSPVNTEDSFAQVQNIVQQPETGFGRTETDFSQSDILQNNVEPVVTKHIYFHVPPPDIEEAPVFRVPEPPKKIYKIIFIKVPSQESVNMAQIQQAIYNQIPPVEDKTLIYVLVKKQEPVQILPPKSKPSEHEVLFVKYKENRSNTPLLADSDFLQENPVLNAEPNLQTGLVNGQR